MANPILEELYDIRREILAEHKHDLADYLRAGLAQTKASGHPIAKVNQRAVRRTAAASSGELSIESQSTPPNDRRR